MWLKFYAPLPNDFITMLINLDQWFQTFIYQTFKKLLAQNFIAILFDAVIYWYNWIENMFNSVLRALIHYKDAILRV